MDSQVVLLCSEKKETTKLTKEIESWGFVVAAFTTTDQAVRFITPTNTCAIITKLGSSNIDFGSPLVAQAKKLNPHIFCCYYSYTASTNAITRNSCTEVANMVTNDLKSLKEALIIVKEFISHSGTYVCPLCKGGKLTEDELLRHTFLYHNQLTSSHLKQTCPVCSVPVDPLPVHLFNEHGPCGRKESTPEHDLKVRHTYTFTLVVCRRKSDGKFLLVHEVCNWGWWLPGGRINKGEDLIQSAIRETKEEAGIDIKITGVLRFEYSPRGFADARMRVIFFAEPVDENQEPKTLPDFESMAAAYVDIGQLAKLPLRSNEPTEWFNYVHRGGVIYPIALLTNENAPAPR